MITRRILQTCLLAAAIPLGLYPQAPSHPTAPKPPAVPQVPPQVALNNKDIAVIQRQLIELLRLSPTLTTVVSHDPTLLSNQEYVSRNNPQLAEFLAAHPEVARNPDFYLFTHINAHDDGPDEALERAVWPELYRMQPRRTGFDELLSNAPPLLAFGAFLCAAIWAVRVFVENRRWSRIFKLQSDVHGKLIDKFSTNQELAAYMQTEAGRRFLEAAPIPLNGEGSPRVPNAVARILTPVQIGTVLILLGIGFLLLRNIGIDYEVPMRVLGVLILMPGIGFILSAGLTWFLAARMGLMPSHGHQPQFDQRP